MGKIIIIIVTYYNNNNNTFMFRIKRKKIKINIGNLGSKITQ